MIGFSTSPFCIGGGGGGAIGGIGGARRHLENSGGFHGYISHVRVWNICRMPDQIERANFDPEWPNKMRANGLPESDLPLVGRRLDMALRSLENIKPQDRDTVKIFGKNNPSNVLALLVDIPFWDCPVSLKFPLRSPFVPSESASTATSMVSNIKARVIGGSTGWNLNPPMNCHRLNKDPESKNENKRPN